MSSNLLVSFGKKKILNPDLLIEDIKNGLSQQEVIKKYKISKKKALTSYRYIRDYHPDIYQLTKITHSKLLSKKLKGNTNGSFKGKFRIPKEDLEEDIDNFLSRKEIKEKYNISDFILDMSLKDYGLSVKYSNNRGYSLVKNLIEDVELDSILTILDPELKDKIKNRYNSSQEELENTVESIHALYLSLYFYTQKVQHIGKSLNKCHNTKFCFASNRGENAIYNYLIHLGISPFEIKWQEKIKDYIYDFYIPSLNICLEVDGSIHRTNWKSRNQETLLKNIQEKDKIKEAILLELGIDFLRIPFSEKGVFDGELIKKTIQNQINKVSGT